MRIPSRGNAPEQLERAADRNRSARRTSRPLLDPHGIYGTRTATRVRAARRRQAVQNLSILAALVSVVALVVWWGRQQRVPSLSRLESVVVSGPVSAPPDWDATGIAVPGESGEFLKLNTNGTPSLFTGDFAFRARPRFVANSIYAASEDGTLYALDAGKEPMQARWRFRAASPISAQPAIWESSAVSGAARPLSLVMVGDDAGNVAALNAQNGARVWTQKLRAAVGEAAVVAPNGNALDGRVWWPLGAGEGGFEGGAACLDVRTGRVLWRVELGATSLAAPALDAARGLLVCATDGGAAFALDARTGRKVWKTFVRPLKGNSSQAVVLRGAPSFSPDGTRVFVGGNDGALRCLDAAKGTELWRFESGAAVRFSPTVWNGAGRTLVACTNDSTRTWILDAATGAPLRKMTASFPSAGAPHISTNAVEVITRDGRLERFALPR
ncbi:MAG TPA: PQQ-binding-like beta-propeller repeat protein [Abditibacteriaceae bacterium]|jgi:outer membrane protein assembly factor BamB